MAPRKLDDTLDAPQLAKALASRQDVRLLDVRTVAEFDRSHIDGSYNVPLGELREYAAELAAVKDPVVLVCRSGARARSAEAVLRGARARSVHVLDGGMIAWRGHGLPVIAQPFSPAAIARRVMGVVGLVLAVLNLRGNPLLAAMAAFVGLRLVMGQSVLPCAVAGTCAVPRDTAAVVGALVAGRPPRESDQSADVAPARDATAAS